MDNSEIQRILDGLDRRLALGEIDLGTYQSLKAKFVSQLSEAPVQLPLDAAMDALPVKAVALKCPGCMAPLPVAFDKNLTNVTCEYCGGTFALQTAAKDMERLRDDVRKWIFETTAQAGKSTVADEVSRAYIFREKIWPQLEGAVYRGTEFYQPTRYLPLFAFPLLLNLRSSPFQDALSLTPDITSLTDQLRGVLAQIQAPELAPFAFGDLEKANLQALEVSCMEIVYFSNIRHSLVMFAPDGFGRARANLQAVRELYSAAAKTWAGPDLSYSKFLIALSIRLDAVERAIELLAKLMSTNEGFITDRIISELENAAMDCERAASEIDLSGRKAKETAPASEGSRNDALAIRMLADCTRIYRQCAVESEGNFTEFLGTIAAVVDKTKTQESDANWLNAFLSNLARYLWTMAGDAEEPIVSDFSWAEAAASVGARRSFLDGNEAFDIQDRILLPFWMAKIPISEQKGRIFKKGQEAQGLVFIEASRPSNFCFLELGGSSLAGQCLKAFESPQSAGQFALVAPTVSSDTALKYIKAFISGSKLYCGGVVEKPGIVYLPAVIVRYANRKGERRGVMLPGAEPRSTTLAVSKLQLGTRKLIVAN